MRAVLAALAAGASILVLGGCATDVVNGVDEARSSAASLGAGIRSSAASLGAGAKQACAASKSSMTQLGSLAGTLAAQPERRAELAPQVRATVDRLGSAIGDRAELRPVLAAGRDLFEATGEATRTRVTLAARQTQVAVRSGQALCALAG